MTDSRPVLALPACLLCTDRGARWEVTIRGCAAWVCDEHLPMVTGHLDPGAYPVALTDRGGWPPATAGEVAEYLAAQEWTYAKTMPKWPHEYVLWRRSADLHGHLRVVAFIREHGEKRRWRGRVHSYWQPGDGWEYWTMRDFDTILNRRKLGADDD
jgi:hypothetical protein